MSDWSNCGSPWTHELEAYALDRFHRRHLRAPRVRDVREESLPDLPSYKTILRRHGSFGRFLRAHGYVVRNPGGQPGHPVYANARSSRGRFARA